MWKDVAADSDSFQLLGIRVGAAILSDLPHFACLVVYYADFFLKSNPSDDHWSDTSRSIFGIFFRVFWPWKCVLARKIADEFKLPK